MVYWSSLQVQHTWSRRTKINSPGKLVIAGFASHLIKHYVHRHTLNKISFYLHLLGIIDPHPRDEKRWGLERLSPRFPDWEVAETELYPKTSYLGSWHASQTLRSHHSWGVHHVTCPCPGPTEPRALCGVFWVSCSCRMRKSSGPLQDFYFIWQVKGLDRHSEYRNSSGEMIVDPSRAGHI